MNALRSSSSALGFVLALSFASFAPFAPFAMGCSNKQDASHFGEFDFDTGGIPDAAERDTHSVDPGSDSAVLGDGASKDANLADLGSADGGSPALCPTTFSSPATVTVGYPMAAGSTGGELLAAITWDELTMAWTTSDFSGVTIHYGDRTGPDAAFSSTHTLSSSLGPFANDKVVIAADGLTMLFVSADHTTITQITRAIRSVEFDPTTATVAPFRRITGPDGEGGAARKIGDLVLSKDGRMLYYTDLNRTAGSTINLSLRLGDGSWDAPNPIIADRLKIESGYHRRPTGLSADTRTLFYFDEVTNTSSVAFRTTGTGLFTEFYAYSPNGQRAMPADSCDRVYLTIEVEGDADAGVDGDVPVVHHIAHAP